eukprot:14059246-Alexandrium_andersonii.AAC.1
MVSSMGSPRPLQQVSSRKHVMSSSRSQRQSGTGCSGRNRHADRRRPEAGRQWASPLPSPAWWIDWSTFRQSRPIDSSSWSA